MRSWVLGLAAALAMAGAGPGAAWAQTPAASLEALTAPANETLFMHGGLIAARDGAVVFRRFEGMADAAAGVLNDASTVFQTASAAKPFTSIAILQLRDAGKLDLDDPVARLLPGFPVPDITVRHLLTHTSGLPDLELFEAVVAADPDHVVTAEDLLPALKAWSQPPPFAPGARFQYSNTNYQLLALIVSTVSGEPFPDYLRRHLFAPAGMNSTYALGGRPPRGAARTPAVNHVMPLLFMAAPVDVRHVELQDARQAQRFRYEGHHLGSTLGDQNVFTTLDDLVRFDAALLRGRVLSLRSQEEAYAPVRRGDGSEYQETEVYQAYGVACSYGMGWEVCRHPRYGRLVGHMGYNRGVATAIYRNLDHGQLIAFYDNTDGDDFAAKTAAVAAVLNGDPAPDLPRRRSLTRAYGVALVEAGPTEALILFNRHRADTAAWAFTRQGLNRLGYDLLRNGRPELALEPFRLNVVLNPDNASAYDSLGEGLAINGRTAEAVAAYRRSLELEPENPGGREALERLEGRTP